MTAPVRVIVADDQELVRSGLALILASRPGVTVVGEASDGVEAVELARWLRPDVVLMDVRMPRLDGIEATRQIVGADPDGEGPAVVVITTFDLDEHVYAALQAGARGFLLKDAGPDLLDQAVRAAASGDALVQPSVTARLLRAFGGRGRRTARLPAERLTSREEDVLAAVARGLTNAEIGAELFLSLGTVKTHLGALMAKLGARNRVELAIWAFETGRAR